MGERTSKPRPPTSARRTEGGLRGSWTSSPAAARSRSKRARLGCEAYALELNPVAHLVELATLAYPARFGDRLVGEVRRWGRVVYEGARAEVGDLYPALPDAASEANHQGRFEASEGGAAGGLVPVAHLWTRTVPCKQCGATLGLALDDVPLPRVERSASGFSRTG